MCLLNLRYILNISDFVQFFSQRKLRDVQNMVSVSLKKKMSTPDFRVLKTLDWKKLWISGS